MNSWWRKVRLGFSHPLTLRSHLVLLTAGTLLPIIIFTVVIAVYLARREQETFKRGATERTRALLTAVDEQLKGSIATLTALATSRRLDTNDLRSFYEEATRVLQSEPNWFTISLAPPSGEPVLNVLQPFGASVPMTGEPESFEQVQRSREPAVGNIVLDPSTNQHAFSVRVPVIRNGIINYVLSAVVRPEIFRALLAPQRLPHDWVGVILDESNNIVARTVNSELTLGKPASQSLQAALSQASEGWFHGRTIEGADVYTPYNRSLFSGWTVAMGIPAAAFEGFLQRSLLSVVPLGLIFLASGMALAWFFTAPIARSIRGLTGIAENLGLGRRPPRTGAIANYDSSSVAEVEDVRQALLKANQLIQERATERDRVESTLRQVSERLELAQEAASVGSFERDLITGDIVWSTSQEKLYGLTPGSFDGKAKTWAERVHPDDLPGVEAKISHAIETKHTLDLEFRILRPDGEMRWLVSQAQVFMDEQGNPRRLMGVNIDITERKKVEQALARSRDEFERMAATSPDFLFIYDLIRDENVYSNRRLEEQLGYTVAQFQVLKSNVADPLMHSEDLSHVREQYRRFDTAADGEVLEWESRLRHADGTYRWFHFRATVFDRTDHSRPRRIIGHSWNVTAQKEAQAALKRFNEDLEKCVVEQTAKLMESNTELLRGMEQQRQLEEQLRQSQKMEAIGTLAGGIAHDFNNILGIILGYTHELLNASGDDHESRSQSLAVIAGSAERGAKIVKQLLTFARKTGTEPKPLDVNALIRETLDILKEIFPKNLRFNSNLDPAIPMIDGDHTQLQQALINLCLNARDAMPEGGTLSIFTGRMLAREMRGRFAKVGGDFVRIDVSDTGVGMDTETRRRVFEPFFTTKKAGGTGLGLSVVYGIVQAHGGLIDLESQNTRGTTFKIFLPVASTETILLEYQPNGRTEGSPVGQTILIVEDEPHMLDLVRLSAEKRGFRVFTASDGEQAVELYQQHWREIDAVVLDWGLPRLDGSAVYRKLKEINQKVDVIGISGYLDFELRDKMLKEGVRDFLQKPCTPNEILAKVLSCRETESPMHETAAPTA
ncbi:MAG: PAS domain-containing protein [Candidatus Binatia bacterium]